MNYSNNTKKNYFRFFGIFDFRNPLFVLRDPELIKQIGVKDFDHFMDHQNFTAGSNEDNLFSNSLFLLSGDKWRDMRATLSPAFTGSKMRQMFILVSQCAGDMSKYFKKEAAAGKTLNYEMKELFSKYSNDVIATSAFGIEVNSFENPKNEFFVMGQQLTNFTFAALLKFLLVSVMPWITKPLKIDLFDTKYEKFFKSMVLENIDSRIKNNIFRPDMINILKDIVKQGGVQTNAEEVAETSDGFSAVEESDVGTKTVVKRKWNENELAAQCFLFFLAGFDTTSTLLTFASYELAINPDIQERLYAEILDNEAELDGQPLSYENVQKLKYVDMFISEMLRLWPPVMSIDRICVKDYTLQSNENSVTIKKGTVVWFPIHGLHTDPKYFKNPDKCDPERFSDENKNDILPGTYLPFGIGPRNCIGNGFFFNIFTHLKFLTIFVIYL